MDFFFNKARVYPLPAQLKEAVNVMVNFAMTFTDI